MALKVQAYNSSSFESFDVIEAIYYTMNNGAHIVNCSFGGESEQSSELEAFAALQNKGILAVCAAGNAGVDGVDLDTSADKIYPAYYDLDNIVSVAANDQDDKLWYSYYGLTSVDLTAPGRDVRSTVPAGQYTQASVLLNTDSGTTTYTAYELEYAGTTDSDGITGSLYDCGRGVTAQDFPSGVSEFIALVQRDREVYFSVKTENAMNAGAIGIIIYNDMDDAVEGWTLWTPGTWIPAVAISRADGESLIAAGLPRTTTLMNKLIQSTSFYANKSGTSMAAPHVAGAAALILAKDPTFDYLKVRSAVINTADKVPSLAGKVASGGRLNALCALYNAVDASPGDLSLDTRVGLDDAVIALQITTGRLPQICPAALTKGLDVNGDGRIGMEEVIFILGVIGQGS
jgi:subtilisin family serine protease